MSIHSRTNLYPGINPHLNNYLQYEKGWKSFHSLHLADIARQIDRQLLDQFTGYYSANEESLQIGVYDNLDVPLSKPGRTDPDIAIFTNQEPSNFPPLYEIEGNVITFAMPDTLSEKDEIPSSIVIYKMENDVFPGRPVTRIELLSPANKYPGSHYVSYLNKRTQTLESSVRLVEIDYLHSRRPILKNLKIYPEEPKAQPYHVLVSDPRPVIPEGKIYAYNFGVIDEIPKVTVPLNGSDTISLDLRMLYNQTFEGSILFHQTIVDYSQEPVHMESFTPADQQTIRDTMAHIAENHNQ